MDEASIAVLLGQVLHDMNRRCPLVIMFALVLGGCQGGSPTLDASRPDAGGDAVRSDGPPRDGPTPDGPAADAPAADGVGKLDTAPEADLATSDAGKQLCLSCIKLRVGRPLIARGPYGDEIDTSFTVIPLAAGSKTFAIDGAAPYAMGGARTQVLAPGNAGSYDECGCWLNHAQKVGSQVHGFVHVESSCNYAASQTHKSMAYASSNNNGLSWTVHGQIITGLDSPTAGKITGEGDCSVVEGGDGHDYAYCLRASDWKTVVARCPTTNPLPGSWKKYHAGQWSQPVWGGRRPRLASSVTRPDAGPPRGRSSTSPSIHGLAASSCRSRRTRSRSPRCPSRSWSWSRLTGTDRRRPSSWST